MSGCGHDGWQAGCPECEREHTLALEAMEKWSEDSGVCTADPGCESCPDPAYCAELRKRVGL